MGILDSGTPFLRKASQIKFPATRIRVFSKGCTILKGDVNRLGCGRKYNGYSISKDLTKGNQGCTG